MFPTLSNHSNSASLSSSQFGAAFFAFKTLGQTFWLSYTQSHCAIRSPLISRSTGVEPIRTSIHGMQSAFEFQIDPLLEETTYRILRSIPWEGEKTSWLSNNLLESVFGGSQCSIGSKSVSQLIS